MRAENSMEFCDCKRLFLFLTPALLRFFLIPYALFSKTKEGVQAVITEQNEYTKYFATQHYVMLNQLSRFVISRSPVQVRQSASEIKNLGLLILLHSGCCSGFSQGK